GRVLSRRCIFVCTLVTMVFRPVIFIFFFSSRRRHTRFSRDWSSDVCSSDLHLRWVPTARTILPSDGRRYWEVLCAPGGAASFDRSEERRVGKECRSRLVPCR